MGLFPTKSASPENQGRLRKRQHLDADNVDLVRIAVVGPASAGKSTVLKQIKLVIMEGYSHEERQSLRPAVYKHTVTCMNMLTKAMKEYGYNYESNDRMNDVSTCNFAVQRIKKETGSEQLSESIADAVKALWADAGVKSLYKDYGKKMHIPPSAEYLFNDIERIRSINYVPTYQDILECYTTVSGASSKEFDYSGLSYAVFDLDGQVNARKRWRKAFDKVEGVIFVAAVGEYDQVLKEDNKTNRLVDAINCFGEVVNSPLLRERPIMLYLNKIDMLERKLQSQIPLTDALPDYRGENELSQAIKYIQTQFVDQIDDNQRSLKRKGTLFTYYTQATSTGQIQYALEATMDILKTKVIYALF